MKERSLRSGTPLSMYISSDPSLFGVGIFYYFSGRLYHCLPDILVSLSLDLRVAVRPAVGSEMHAEVTGSISGHMVQVDDSLVSLFAFPSSTL